MFSLAQKRKKNANKVNENFLQIILPSSMTGKNIYCNFAQRQSTKVEYLQL